MSINGKCKLCGMPAVTCRCTRTSPQVCVCRCLPLSLSLSLSLSLCFKVKEGYKKDTVHVHVRCKKGSSRKRGGFWLKAFNTEKTHITLFIYFLASVVHPRFTSITMLSQTLGGGGGGGGGSSPVPTYPVMLNMCTSLCKHTKR